MDIRPYASTDKQACLSLFDGNLPESFQPEDRFDFEGWLDDPRGSYFVMEHEGALVACGGCALENAQLASITWLIVRSDLRRQGLGRFLLFYCLKALPAGVTHVRLETIPAAAGFFEKQGFRIARSEPRRVELIKKLLVCP